MPRKMTDAQLKAKILKADAQAKLRSRVLELFWEGKLSMAAIAAHPDIKRSKATVQSIIERFGDRPDTQTKHAGGRRSILNKRYPLVPSFEQKLFFFGYFQAAAGHPKACNSEPILGVSEVDRRGPPQLG